MNQYHDILPLQVIQGTFHTEVNFGQWESVQVHAVKVAPLGVTPWGNRDFQKNRLKIGDNTCNCVGFYPER